MILKFLLTVVVTFAAFVVYAYMIEAVLNLIGGKRK